MANSTPLQKKNGQYLWFSLLGLGFQPDIATSSITSKTSVAAKRINLGVSMFDRPNKDACQLVITFLLEKLNPTRFREAYRLCWPVLDFKTDADFRKVTCAWLREIMEESGIAGSKVVASLFLSPGGPKFINLMLHLVNHIMQLEMNKFTVDSWVPTAAIIPASTLDMAAKRFSLVRTRFLRAALDRDHFSQEYKTRNQHLLKSVREMKEDVAKYNELLRQHCSEFMLNDVSLVEKTEKVRSLWSTIDGMLSTIKEEQNAVQSVLKGEADQCMLDGTNQTLKVPRCLLERIEQLPHQLNSGNVYEGGQLNLLCVVELLNHALQLLKEERSRVSHTPRAQINPQALQDKCHQMARVLQDLHHIRQKISEEEIPRVRNAIRDLEANWNKKWMDTLKDTPLASFLNEDPALGFLSPMAPLSFEPACEATYRSSVFSQFPAKLPDEMTADNKAQSLQEVLPPYSVLTSPPAPAEEPENVPVITETSPSNVSLDWLLNMPASPPRSVQSVPTPQASVTKTAQVHWKGPSMTTKTEILDMEYENLADQFADAVTSTTPPEDRNKISNLEDLFSTLQRDPFSTRKQLPRTPDSLIMDVKSSWRKAVQEGEAKKLQTVEFNDSITQKLSPLTHTLRGFLSPDAPSWLEPWNITPSTRGHGSRPVCQQEVLLKSSLLMDTFNTEAVDSPSGKSSSVVHFTLDCETLPELPSCESLLSLEDTRSEDEDELLIPSLSTKRTPLHDEMKYSDGLMHTRTPECLSGFRRTRLDTDYIKEPKSPADAIDKTFSLDLDKLNTPSPSKQKEYSFPKLFTFSPIDDS